MTMAPLLTHRSTAFHSSANQSDSTPLRRLPPHGRRCRHYRAPRGTHCCCRPTVHACWFHFCPRFQPIPIYFPVEMVDPDGDPRSGDDHKICYDQPMPVVSKGKEAVKGKLLENSLGS